MKQRSGRTPVTICISVLLGFLLAGCGSMAEEAVENDSPPPALLEREEEREEEREPVPEEETARIGSPEFPPSNIEAELNPSQPLPSPELPETAVRGILKRKWTAALHNFRVRLEEITDLLPEMRAFLTFDAPEYLPDVSGILEKEAEREAERRETASKTREVSIPVPSREEPPPVSLEREESVPRSAERRTGGDPKTPEPESRTAAARTPPEETEPPSETLYGMPGDTLGVTLDGRGWIFTGMAEGNGGGDLSFVSRANTPQYTDFIFQAEGLGDFLLNFQKQDFSTGDFETKKVAVRIVGSDEFARIVAGMKSGEFPGGSGAAETEEHLREQKDEATRLLRLGRREEALNIYTSLDRPDDPEILDITAELAFDIGRYQTAREAWTENLAAEGGYREKALVGLTDIALRREDITDLDEYAHRLLGITGVSTEQQLYRSGLLYSRIGRYGSAITFLEAYLQRYYTGAEADIVFYLLGTVYEKNTEYRNLERARFCYQAVVDDYPTSIYWDRARERLRYLDRHFFSVR